MEQIFSKLNFITNGEGFQDITEDLNLFINKNNFCSGILNLTTLHTSCSLTINENADPSVRVDFETHFNKLVSENDLHYTHTLEGPDDMTSHIKSTIIGSSVTFPVKEGKPLLGIWQGIYLCEHRNNFPSRKIVVTIYGEKN